MTTTPHVLDPRRRMRSRRARATLSPRRSRGMASGPHPLAPRAASSSSVIASRAAVRVPRARRGGRTVATPTRLQRVLLATATVLESLATREIPVAVPYADIVRARDAERDRWLGLAPPRSGA